MKKALLLLLFAISASIVQAQQTKPQKVDPNADVVIDEPVSLSNLSKATPNDTVKIFTSVEQQPEFPGGPLAFSRFLAIHLKYPAKAVKDRKEGKVFTAFVVEKDGSLTDVRILRGVSAEIDTEALRALRSSPKWKPGIQNGRPVRVTYTLPISFKLPAAATIDSLKIFTAVEHQPSFPGGEAKFSAFIKANLQYPPVARDNSVQGKVFLQFVVEKDGSLTDIKVVRGIGSGCDEEAVRLLHNSPKWNPGMQNGRPVRVYYTMPIYFQL